MSADILIGQYKGPQRPDRPLIPGNKYSLKVNEKPSGKVVVDVLDKATSIKIKYPSKAKYEGEWE